MVVLLLGELEIAFDGRRYSVEALEVGEVFLLRGGWRGIRSGFNRGLPEGLSDCRGFD